MQQSLVAYKNVVLNGCVNFVTTKVMGDARLIESNDVNMPSAVCAKCAIKKEIFRLG